MDKKVKQYLFSLDAEPYCAINDFGISQGIIDIIQEFKEKPIGESLYELLAFDLYPRGEGGLSEWNTFFGSKASWLNKDGSTTEVPSLQQINNNVVEYWKKRALEAKHPVLVERYADLVGDFSKHIGQVFDYKLAQKVIDSIILICEQDLVEDTYQRLRLHRALDIAKKINDGERLRKIAEVVIATEKKIAKDDKPGLWGFSLEWFVLENEGKDILKEDEIKDLIKEIEDKMSRLLNVEDPDPWPIECAVNLLVPYYIKNEDTQNTLRVLLTLEEAYRKNKRSNSDGMLKVNYLEKLDALYSQNNKLLGISSHIEKIRKELPEASKESLNSMKTISSEVKIKNEDIEKITKGIFEDKDTKAPLSLSDVVSRLIGNFLVHKESSRKQVEKISKQFVFQFLVEQKRISPDGHTEVIIPPLGEDYEAHIFNQAFQTVQLLSPFLTQAMRLFKEKFSIEDIANYLAQSPLFVDEEKDYLTEGLKAYWSNNYLTASQNFLPYIEVTFRRLIAGGGGITLRPSTKSKYSVYEYKTLDALLNDEIINGVFNFDICFYFKLLLTHPLGWNLRNNLAHGVNLNSFFREDVSDRLFHIILLLGLVRNAPLKQKTGNDL